MRTRYALFLKLIGSVFALALLAAPSLGTAALTITQVSVVVGGAVYCDTSVAQPVVCTAPIWNLGASGLTLNGNQTLILTQMGTTNLPTSHGGEDFDTSDRGAAAQLLGCSDAPGGTPCTVQIYINGSQVFNDPSGNLNPLTAFNNDFVDLNSVPATLFQEAEAWVLQVAPNFTGTGYKLELGYADNIHGGTCDGALGDGAVPSCFPQRVWDITGENPASPGNGAATYFLGAGIGPIGNCATNPLGFPTGVAHTNKDGAGNIVGCYDAGALRITANPVPHLKVVKTPDGDSFSQGGAVSFTIVVSNDGDAGSVATNVQLSDQLPTAGGLNWSGATVTPSPACSVSATSLLTCNLGSINAGSSVTVTVSLASTPPAACVPQSNPIALATASNAPSAQDSGSLTCTPIPHLKVVKTPDGGSFSQGGAVSFTIVVSNDGGVGSVATNAHLSDQLPTNGGLNWSGATVTTTQGSCSVSATSLLTCSFGSITAGTPVTVTVSLASTPAAACQSQPNPVASATADGPLSAQDSGSLTCTPPVGNLTTVTQGGWGAPAHGNNPGTVLNAYFTAHPGYSPTIGSNACVGGKTATWTSADAVRAFLPAGGPPSVLTANATNPTSTSAGVFAGQVLALTLNTQVLSSGSSLLSYVITTGPATGKTVAQVLADADKAIGGCGLPSYVTSISQLNDVVDYINNLFD